jgi:hypothetical protein
MDAMDKIEEAKELARIETELRSIWKRLHAMYPRRLDTGAKNIAKGELKDAVRLAAERTERLFFMGGD